MDEYYKETFHESLQKFVAARDYLQSLKSTSQIDKKSMIQALEAYLSDIFGPELMAVLTSE
jgi:hypothetical protein